MNTSIKFAGTKGTKITYNSFVGKIWFSFIGWWCLLRNYFLCTIKLKHFKVVVRIQYFNCIILFMLTFNNCEVFCLFLKKVFLITGRFSFNHFEVIRISFNHSLILKYVLISFYCGISFFFLEFVFKRKEKNVWLVPNSGKAEMPKLFF